MKRRDFLTNTALLGAGIPLGMTSAVMTSCSQLQGGDAPVPGKAPDAPVM
ncbi:twin-arginine translocation signal domain-containing protein [Parabacteroides sp. AM08-6]|nr:twin-arginine translocation signal domain-containing protein [Parabacteroides sp. AM08-6]